MSLLILTGGGEGARALSLTLFLFLQGYSLDWKSIICIEAND